MGHSDYNIMNISNNNTNGVCSIYYLNYPFVDNNVG